MSVGEGRGLRRALILSALLFGCMALPAAAFATTRYAAPGGTATPAECSSPDNPCTIYQAAQGIGVAAGDEVVIAPGSYSDTAGDLGPNDYVDPVANTVHGAPGEPRPVITLDELGNGGFGAFKVETGNLISHLEIDTATAETNINLAGGVVDDLIAHSSQESGPMVCQFSGSAILRDSACISSGAQARTVGAVARNTESLTATLRNVTAVASGTNGNAIDFFATDTATVNVDAKSVIGYATGLGGFDLYPEEFNSSAVTIAINYSNYSSQGAQGTPTVTGANNQLTEPVLASDSIHQLANSPTVNAGADTTGDSTFGTSDIDGQSRAIGTPDIGADELGHPTTTAVSCLPTAPFIGGATTCTAIVTDTASSGAGVPTGGVSFTSGTTGGNFSSGGMCSLTPADSTAASCSVTYTPGKVGSGTHQITADYSGDTTRDSSSGSDDVAVSLRPTATTVSCAPDTFVFGATITTCHVTVTEVSGAYPITPAGDVALDSDAGGSFGPGCAELGSAGTGAASCSLTYTPKTAVTQKVTASYAGDSAHDSSQSFAFLFISPPALPTITGTRFPPCATLRKKLKKAKKAHNRAKVKKLRKKLRKLGC